MSRTTCSSWSSSASQSLDTTRAPRDCPTGVAMPAWEIYLTGRLTQHSAILRWQTLSLESPSGSIPGGRTWIPGRVAVAACMTPPLVKQNGVVLAELAVRLRRRSPRTVPGTAATLESSTRRMGKRGMVSWRSPAPALIRPAADPMTHRARARLQRHLLVLLLPPLSKFTKLRPGSSRCIWPVANIFATLMADTCQICVSLTS